MGSSFKGACLSFSESEAANTFCMTFELRRASQSNPTKCSCEWSRSVDSKKSKFRRTKVEGVKAVCGTDFLSDVMIGDEFASMLGCRTAAKSVSNSGDNVANVGGISQCLCRVRNMRRFHGVILEMESSDCRSAQVSPSSPPGPPSAEELE